MSSQFQPYLESIRTAYAKWWERYTFTDATGKQRQSGEESPFFDFGLMVQTVKREEREREEKIERFSVLEGLRKYADQQVLLVGRPGSGKSTALARLMLEEATNPQARIPVLVELRYWQGSIDKLIQDFFIRHDLPVELVAEALKRSLILFDGVNELPSEEARSQLSAFRRNHPKLPMIFTTRDLSLGGDLGIEKKLEMQPLTEAQIREFVRSYLLPEQAEQMLRQLNDRLREFGQTPLLLWMLCELFQQTETIPENLGLVFRKFTQGYERYLKEDVRIESDRSWWKPVLQQLAWVMMQGEKPTEFRVAISREEAVRAIAQFLDRKVTYAEDFARKCLRDLQKYHLIQVGTNCEELEFRHQLIQEYYAAEALLERLPKLNDEQLKQEYLNFLKWTEPLALMLALVEDEELTIQVVSLALDVDRMLGVRMARESKWEYQVKILNLLTNLAGSKALNAAYDVGRRTDRPLKELGDGSLTAKKALPIQVQQDIYSSVHQLIQTLEPEEVLGWREFAKIIGGLDNKTAIPALLATLDEGDGSDELCIFVLGLLECEQVVPQLLNALKNEEEFIRGLAVLALSKIGTSSAIGGVIQALEDSDVSEIAAELLIQLSNEAALPGLLQILKDEWLDSDLRIRAAKALMTIGGEDAIEGLLHALQDWDFEVAWAVADMLKATGKEEQASCKLLEEIRDGDYYVRSQLAIPLGYLGNVRAIPMLITAIDHEDPDICWKSIYVLGRLLEQPVSALPLQPLQPGSDLAIPRLVQLILGSSDGNAKSEAVEALSKLASPQQLSEFWRHSSSSPSFLSVIKSIQKRFKYYNYEIYQAHLEAQKADRQTPQNSDRSSTYYIEKNYGNLNTGTVNIAGDQTGVESSIPNKDRAAPNSFCD